MNCVFTRLKISKFDFSALFECKSQLSFHWIIFVKAIFRVDQSVQLHRFWQKFCFSHGFWQFLLKFSLKTNWKGSLHLYILKFLNWPCYLICQKNDGFKNPLLKTDGFNGTHQFSGIGGLVECKRVIMICREAVHTMYDQPSGDFDTCSSGYNLLWLIPVKLFLADIIFGQNFPLLDYKWLLSERPFCDFTYIYTY